MIKPCKTTKLLFKVMKLCNTINNKGFDIKL